MDINKIKKIINGDPAKLIHFMEKNGVDFSGLENNIAKKLVREKFSITDEQFNAVDFIFWVSYFTERVAEDLICSSEKNFNVSENSIRYIVNELHFGAKIKVIEELHTANKDSMITIMRKVQNYRNDIAHGKFSNLKYGGWHLADNRAQIKLLADLRDAFLIK